MRKRNLIDREYPDESKENPGLGKEDLNKLRYSLKNLELHLRAAKKAAKPTEVHTQQALSRDQFNEYIKQLQR